MDYDVVIVVGYGVNEVVVPITVYRDMESAISELSAILGKPRDAQECNSSPIWDLPENPIGVRTEIYGNRADEVNSYLQECLFKSYYDGCGGCYAVHAIPIRFGQLKLFTFNLD